MKPSTACRQCRLSKRKCIRLGEAPGDVCEPCKKRKLACLGPFLALPASPRSLLSKPASAQAASTVPTSRIASEDIPTPVALRLVDHYLSKLHNRPHSLFHPTKLRQQVENGSISRPLLLALCSMGSRFDQDDGLRVMEDIWMEASKRLLLIDLENICIENIQTCILIANLQAAHLKPSSEALFFRIAISQLQIMEAEISPARVTLVDLEIKRRTWWTLFMADRWSSSSLGLSGLIQDNELAVDLPMDEVVFESLNPNQIRLQIPWQPGLWAHMISLVRLFGPIQDLNRRNVYGYVESSELERSVVELSNQLEEWERLLPPEAQMNEANLEFHTVRGTGGPFIALHLGYHHYSTLLYFRYLEPLPSPGSIGSVYYKSCTYHASSYSKLIKFARQREGCEVIYPTVGHMAVVSSSVLLHMLLFGDEQDIPTVRESLNANFAAILELGQYWPNTQPMIQRLIHFQNFCLLSSDYRTHQLDGWMIRFLIEYSLLLEEKDVRPIELGIDLDINDFSNRTKVMTEQGRYTSFLNDTIEF